MKLYFNVIWFIFLGGCQSDTLSKNQNINVKAISLVTGDKTTYFDGYVESESGEINIIYINNYIIYKIPKLVYVENFKTITRDTIRMDFIKPDTIFNFYVTEKNRSLGIRYNSIDSSDGKIFAVDSLLKEHGIHSSMFGVYSLNLEKPSQILKLSQTITVKKYLNKKLVNSDPDSIYRYFDSSLKDIEFTYSRALDSIEKNKLVETCFINIYPKQTGNKPIRLESCSGMKIIKLTNMADYLTIIRLYSKEINDD